MPSTPSESKTARCRCPGCGKVVAAAEQDHDEKWTWSADREHPCPERGSAWRSGQAATDKRGICRRPAGHPGKHRYTGDFESLLMLDLWHEDCYEKLALPRPSPTAAYQA